MYRPETVPFLQSYLCYINKEKHQKQLEKWTELKCSDIVFDSNIDDWSQGLSEFDRRIIGNKQLTFLIEDEDGEIFGGRSNGNDAERA